MWFQYSRLRFKKSPHEGRRVIRQFVQCDVDKIVTRHEEIAWYGGNCLTYTLLLVQYLGQRLRYDGRKDRTGVICKNTNRNLKIPERFRNLVCQFNGKPTTNVDRRTRCAGIAVAAHLEPEVLAVGDVQFQKKCLSKLDEVSREGRTVLFVSHNLDAVRKLCRSAIIIQQGRLAFNGSVESAIEQYLSLGTNRIAARTAHESFLGRLFSKVPAS
jgi:hypothetical protein